MHTPLHGAPYNNPTHMQSDIAGQVWFHSKNLKVLEMISPHKELNVTSRVSRDSGFASELRNFLQNLSF